MHHGAATLLPSEPLTAPYTTPEYYTTTSSSMPSYSPSSSLSLAPTHHATWPQLVFFVTYWGFINANGVNVRDVRSSKLLPPPSTVLEGLNLPSSSPTFTHQDITSSSSHQDIGSSRVLTSNSGANVLHHGEPLSNNNHNREEPSRGDADTTNGEGPHKNREQGNDMDSTSLLEPSTGFPPPDTGWDKHHPPLHSIATPSLTVYPSVSQSVVSISPSLSQSVVSITPEGTTAQLYSDSSMISEDQIISSDIQSAKLTDSLHTDYGPTGSSLVDEIPFVSDSEIYDSSVLLLRESTEQVEAETPHDTPIVAMTTVQDDLRHTSSVVVRHNNDFVRHHQLPHDGGTRRPGEEERDQSAPQKHEDVTAASTPDASSSNIVNSEVSQVSQTTPIVRGTSVSSSDTVKTLLSQPLSTVTEILSPSVTVSNIAQSQLSQAMTTDSLVLQPMSKVTSTSRSIVSDDNIRHTLLSMPVPTVTVSAVTEGLNTDALIVSPSVSQPVTEQMDNARIDMKTLEASRYFRPDDNIPSSITMPNIEHSSSGPTKTTQTSSSQVEGIYTTQALEPSISETPSIVDAMGISSIKPTYSTSGLPPEEPLSKAPEVATPQLSIPIFSSVSEVVSWESSAGLYVISTSGGSSVMDTQAAEPSVVLSSDLASSLTGQFTEELHLYNTQTLQYGTVIGGTQSLPIMDEATLSGSYTAEVPTITTEWQGTISSYHPSVHAPSSGILTQAATCLPQASPSLQLSSQFTLAPKSLLPSSSSHTAGGQSNPGRSTPVAGVPQTTLSSAGGILIHPTETNSVPVATASPTYFIQGETVRVSQTQSVYLGDSETHGFSTEKGQTFQTAVSGILSPTLAVHTQQTPTESRPTPEGSSSIGELDLSPTSPLPAEATSAVIHVPPDSASQQPEVTTAASIATVPMTTASVGDRVVRVTSAAVTWQDEVVSKEDQLGTSTGSHDTTLPLVTRAAVTMVTPSSQGVGIKRGDNSYVTKTAKGWRSKGPITSPRSSATIRMTSTLLSAVTTAPARPSVYVTFKLRMAWSTFCSRIEEFKRVLMGILNKSVHGHYKLVLDGLDECSNVKNVARRSAEITVDVYLADNKGHYDVHMTSKFARRINRRILDQSPGSFKGKFIKVYVVGLDVSNNLLAKQKEPTPSMTTAMVAGITVASVVSSLILALIVTQMVIIGKRRSVKTMRTVGYDSARPSIDVHSLEESIQMISIATMAGGLSYINPAMDSDENKDYTSNPLTLAGLQELLSDPDNEDIEDEFLMLPNPMPKISEVPEGVEDRNRYANVIPIRETRVPLVTRPGSDHSAYINANFVRGYGGKSRMYIATQAPMENTRVDFWEMIWQQQTQVILMLTGIEENGHSKSTEYWPNTEGSDVVRIYGDYHVQLQLRDVTSFWIRSVLVLKNMETNLCREVQHLWLTTWPPSGVPEDPCVVLAFLEAAEPYIQRSHGPPVVHCSPGTGRTGTVLAVDMGRRAWDLTHQVDVLQIVRQLREDRAGAIQTKEQYALVYKTLLEHTLRVSDPSTVSMTSSLISEPT